MSDQLSLVVSRALLADECQRLAEWALIGSVQRAALESFSERLLAAAPAAPQPVAEPVSFQYRREQVARQMATVYEAFGAAAPAPHPVIEHISSAKMCSWTQDDEGSEVWHPSCGKGMFSLTEGGPKDNGMKFCCYCGKEVDEHPWVVPTESGDAEACE